MADNWDKSVADTSGNVYYAPGESPSGLSNESVALRFTQETTTGSYTRTALVDNVSMTAIPEPMGGILILGGMGLIAFLRKRFRR